MQFMIYRQNGSALKYYKVDSSSTIFQTNTLFLEHSCSCMSIPSSTIFKIEPNDLIAACMPTWSTTQPLFVTSQQRNTAFRLRSSSEVPIQCEGDDWNNIEIGLSVAIRLENILLVEASIGK